MAFCGTRRDALLTFALHLCKGCSKYTRILFDNFNIVRRQPTMEEGVGRGGEEAGWKYHRNSGFQRLNGGTAAARVNSIEV